MIGFLKEAASLYREKKKANAEIKEKQQIAKLFNDRYTYRKEFIVGLDRLDGTAMFGITPRGGYAWMCPDCNAIHHPTSCSVFTGVQYPSCCSHPNGHRLYANIRTH